MHTTFILDILKWIDDNLSRDISVHDIVARSGYSSAQLHRLFRTYVGCTVNEYLMGKRMHKCAYALKFTNTSVKDLAEVYHYANPQAFSRFFKSFFGMSPMEYRNNSGVDLKQLFSWKCSTESQLADCKVDFIHLDELNLMGVSGGYLFPPEEAGKPHAFYRSAIENEFQLKTQRPVSQVYALCKPLNIGTGMVNFEYHVGLPEFLSSNDFSLAPLPSVKGDYLKLSFQAGHLLPFEMSSIAYWGYISKNNIRRREGYDIEVFDYRDGLEFNTYEYAIHIPVVFNEDLIALLINIRS